jgi:hypothetical protein
MRCGSRHGLAGPLLDMVFFAANELPHIARFACMSAQAAAP